MDPTSKRKYRALFLKTYRDIYHSNQSAMAKALDIGQSNIGRIVKTDNAGFSEQTAQKLCELAGVPYPLGDEHAVPTVHAPPPAPRQHRQPPRRDVLTGVLEYFGDEYHPSVHAAAAALREDIREMKPRELMDALGELDKILRPWVKKYAEPIPEITNPTEVLGHHAEEDGRVIRRKKGAHAEA